MLWLSFECLVVLCSYYRVVFIGCGFDGICSPSLFFPAHLLSFLHHIVYIFISFSLCHNLYCFLIFIIYNLYGFQSLSDLFLIYSVCFFLFCFLYSLHYLQLVSLIPVIYSSSHLWFLLFRVSLKKLCISIPWSHSQYFSFYKMVTLLQDYLNSLTLFSYFKGTTLR